MKRLNLLPCVLLLMLLGIHAQHRNAGEYLFDFINVNPDAYSASLGGSSVSVPGGGNGYFQNPAILSDNSSPAIFLGYAPVLTDINVFSVAAGRSVDKLGVVAFSFINLSSGDIPVVLENGGAPVYTDDVAGSRSYAAALSWAYRFADYFSAGVTLRGLYERLETGEAGEDFYSSAVVIDAGVHYNFFRKRLCVGGVIKNVGYVTHQYSGSDLPLPSGVEVGISYTPQHMRNVKLCCDVGKSVGDFVTMRTGLEAYLFKEYLAVRVGLPFSSEDLKNLGDEDFEKTNNNSVAFGIGVNPPIRGIKTRFNFALQLKTQGAPPVFQVSNATEF